MEVHLKMAVVTQIQARRGTAAQWTSANPTLAAGEWGYETDTGKVKIGSGSTAWNSLSYIGQGEVTLNGTETLTNKTHTFVLTDNGKLVTASNGSAQTYTIPLNSSVAYATGAQINIIQIGAGQVTIQGAGGVTVASSGATSTAPKLRAQYSSATCIKVATDTWYVIGDIA
jgi:hypothetical protein